MTFSRTCITVSFGIVVALLVGAGCKKASPTPPKATVEWIDPKQIQLSPQTHNSLPDALLIRIQRVHATFADVDGTPFEKWVDDFKRDLDPESNVRIWEDMEVAYNKYLNGRNLNLPAKKEVFKVVLLRSMASEDDVLARLKLVRLSADDAKTIMAGYPAAPKPIDVIESP